jgi:uncharacterized RDD family membrane protein YckC
MNVETQQNLYAPPEARVSDFRETSDSYEMAGRATRLGAAVLDMLIFGLVAVPVGIAAGFDPDAMADGSAYMGLAGLVTVGLLIVLVAITIVLVHRNGQSIGKWLVNIKVVRRDGSRASLGRIFWLRNFVNGIPSAIPIVGNFYWIVDSLFIFGARQQCIHDLIADTIVVNA